MNDFYTLSEINAKENKWSGKIAFESGHAIFKGHFPGQPVVPGVCMMQIVKEVLEKEIGLKMRFLRAPQVKFLQLITPGVMPVMHLEWSGKDGRWSVSAGFKEEKDLFKMTAELTEAETN